MERENTGAHDGFCGIVGGIFGGGGVNLSQPAELIVCVVYIYIYVLFFANRYLYGRILYRRFSC